MNVSFNCYYCIYSVGRVRRWQIDRPFYPGGDGGQVSPEQKKEKETKKLDTTE